MNRKKAIRAATDERRIFKKRVTPKSPGILALCPGGCIMQGCPPASRTLAELPRKPPYSHWLQF
jgi:hypothetical protein